MNRFRTFFSLVLLVAALACGTLSAMSALKVIGPTASSSSVAVAARPDVERAPASRPDNPRPPRNLVKLPVDQFDVITSQKKLVGSPIRHIVVQPDRIQMLTGDRVTWAGTFASLRGFNGRISLTDVARLVARSPEPDALRQISPGVYLLQAGLAQSPGTRMEIVAPGVKELRLASKPYVYLVGVNANALFRGVKVTSWLTAENRPDADPFRRRPFVAYDDGGRLDIVNSELSYLGGDTSKAYGVTWGKGTTGHATRSVFHHNLFGIYTSGAVNVTFRQNTVRDNAIYGFDPHTSSTGLRVVDNEVYGNNSHGIIFSENVRDSVVEGNRSYRNGGNGIMMDEKCDQTVIRNNEVWDNREDGIVIQGSSRVLVTENTVTNNGVGVRVNANELGPTVGTQVVANTLDRNDLGVQVYSGSRDTVSRDNLIRDSVIAGLAFAEPSRSESDTVVGAQKGLVADSTQVALKQLTMSNVDFGVLASAESRVDLEAVRINARDTALNIDATATATLVGIPGVSRSEVTGARKGVVVNGNALLRDVSIQGVERGVLVGPQARVVISTTDIVASSKGVEVIGAESLTRVQLLSSDVRAPEPVVGTEVGEATNNLDAVPSWLAIAGAVFVALALVLHFGHRVLSPMSGARHKAMPASGGGHG